LQPVGRVRGGWVPRRKNAAQDGNGVVRHQGDGIKGTITFPTRLANGVVTVFKHSPGRHPKTRKKTLFAQCARTTCFDRRAKQRLVEALAAVQGGVRKQGSL